MGFIFYHLLYALFMCICRYRFNAIRVRLFQMHPGIKEKGPLWNHETMNMDTMDKYTVLLMEDEEDEFDPFRPKHRPAPKLRLIDDRRKSQAMETQEVDDKGEGEKPEEVKPDVVEPDVVKIVEVKTDEVKTDEVKTKVTTI